MSKYKLNQASLTHHLWKSCRAPVEPMVVKFIICVFINWQWLLLANGLNRLSLKIKLGLQKFLPLGPTPSQLEIPSCRHEKKKEKTIANRCFITILVVTRTPLIHTYKSTLKIKIKKHMDYFFIFLTHRQTLEITFYE